MAPEQTAKLLPDLSQIGVVVEDIDLAVASLSLLGIGPWRYLDPPARSMEIDGRAESVTIRVAFANLGALQLELIQPLEGAGIHRQHLESQGEGLDHLGMYAADKDARTSAMIDLGFSVLLGGLGDRVSYLQSERSGGLVFELIVPHLRRSIEMSSQA